MSSIFLQFWCNVIHCKSAYKNGSSIICVSRMLEHVCYVPFSLQNCKFGKYLIVVFCSRKHRSRKQRTFFVSVYDLSPPPNSTEVLFIISRAGIRPIKEHYTYVNWLNFFFVLTEIHVSKTRF